MFWAYYCTLSILKSNIQDPSLLLLDYTIKTTPSKTNLYNYG